MNKSSNALITDKIYRPLDFFMLRTPVFPIEFYRDIFCNTMNIDDNIYNLIKISEDPVLRETIAVASMDLLLSLDKLNSSMNRKEKEKIVSSLAKYLIRMSTRTTPFGLFSGVTAGEFADKTNIKLKSIKSYKKRARPDAEWMYKVTGTLEKNEHILNDLIITWNSIARFSGSRVEIPYLSIYVQERNEDLNTDDTISIRASKAVQYVCEKSYSGIRYGQLFSLLIEKYPDTDRKKIEYLLKELLDKEFIITNLRPPLDISDPLLYIINKLKSIKAAETEFCLLSQIYEMIADYNQMPIGDGVEQFHAIVNKMKVIKNSKNYLEVDLKLIEEPARLNKSITDDLAKVAGFLSVLSSVYDSPENIEQYKNEFMERYGEQREVPLLELIDMDRGLGFPAEYTMPVSNKQLYRTEANKNSSMLEERLLYKIIKAINNKDSVAVIDYDDIDGIVLETFNLNNVPDSLELNAYVKASSQNDIDMGNYELFLGPNIGSDSAGKTFGRFSDILSREIGDNINEINVIEKQGLGSRQVFAQLLFAANKGSVGNIVSAPNIRDYEIILSSSSSGDQSKSISIQDLVVGITENRFYFKSTSLNKEVIVKTNHMLNRAAMPNICRFLLDISEDGKISWFPIKLFNSLSRFPYIPQIKINNVTISPRAWNINERLAGVDLKSITEETFFTAIERWRTEWNVPDFVYQTEADNRLMFDLRNKIHLRELFIAFKKKKSIRITDIEFDYNNLWINNPQGNYISEIVIPFVKNIPEQDNANSVDGSKKCSSNISTLDDCRTKYPGDDWLYLKLYGNYTREQELIAFEISRICEELIVAGYVDEFFFMRYSDPNHHIRLRFRGKPEVLLAGALPRLNTWFKTLKNDGLLTRVEIDTYTREIERYGGIAAIDYAEKVFYQDSIFVSNILFMQRLRKIDIDIEEIAICSIVSYLNSFNINFLDQIKLLDIIVKPSDYRTEFQKNRSRYMFMANSDNDWENLNSTESGVMLFNALKIRAAVIKEFAAELHKLNISNKLTNSLENIFLSVIHLHCNRLFGTDRKKESEILSCTRHTLYALKYAKKEK